MTTDLQHDPQFNELAETALADYLQWFDGEDQNDEMIDDINDALNTGDYWHCDYLDDALSAWADYLRSIVDERASTDDVNDAQSGLDLIDQYFAR